MDPDLLILLWMAWQPIGDFSLGTVTGHEALSERQPLLENPRLLSALTRWRRRSTCWRSMTMEPGMQRRPRCWRFNPT